jgi:hypothetical protein
MCFENETLTRSIFHAVILDDAARELGAIVCQYPVWKPVSTKYPFDELACVLSSDFSCWLSFNPLSEFIDSHEQEFVAALSPSKGFEDV